MKEGLLVVGALVLAATLIPFVQIAGPVSAWNVQTLAALGTFLAGTLGPATIIVAAFQYFNSAEAQRNFTRIAQTDRHRIDIRHSIEQRCKKIEDELETVALVTSRNNSISLRDFAATGLSFLPTYKIPDYAELEQRGFKEEFSSKREEILIFEKLGRLTLDLNFLRALAEEHDRISQNSIMTEDLRSRYFFLINNLMTENYPIKPWDRAS